MRPVFFDGHCDTALKVLDEGGDFVGGDRSMHLDLPRLIASGVRALVFACFVLSERYPGEEADRAEQLLDTVERMVATSDGQLRITRTRQDLHAAFAGGAAAADESAAAILGLEGADPLEGKAENLRRFFDRGVRDLIFAWKDNPFSGTAFGEDTPLTQEGVRLLGLCEELGAMVDVSHLSDAAFGDVCRASSRPFVASHSDCRALCGSARNLTDGMIRALADGGGVMGINLSTAFLSPDSLDRWQRVKVQLRRERLTWQEADKRAKAEAAGLPRPSFDWIVRHVVHAIDVGGEDVVGLGGDLDGILHLPEGIDGVEGYPQIADALRTAGLSDAQVEKVCWRNFVRVFDEVLPD